MRMVALALALMAMWLTGCHRAELPAHDRKIATTTSYLEAVARDLLGNDLDVVRLAEPGTCPGHFDIRPSQVTALRQCRALLRFDFQRSLDAKLVGPEADRSHIIQVSIKGGMCRPESYVVACRQVADSLVISGLLSRATADARLRSIEARLDTLSRDLTNRLAQAGLAGVPVIASRHQRDFCEWLGLQVIAAFSAADTASVGEIEDAITAGELAKVRLVIANLPEGRRAADALAERLKGRVVVFENFPGLHDHQVSFDEMLSANVRALLQGAAP